MDSRARLDAAAALVKGWLDDRVLARAELPHPDSDNFVGLYESVDRMSDYQLGELVVDGSADWLFVVGLAVAEWWKEH